MARDILKAEAGAVDLPLLAELNRRRVFRALVGYGIAAFALLRLGLRGIIDALAGRRQEALRAAREIEEQSRRTFVPPSIAAGIWVALDDKDKAFPLLLQACAVRDDAMLTVKVDPFYDGIRSDPRFAQLLKCMNLE
jgi:hypothetical protein